LNIDEGEVRSEEEWSLRITRTNDLRDLRLELLSLFLSLAEILGLQNAVEQGDNLSIDLEEVS
jgi:hypothetical protein